MSGWSFLFYLTIDSKNPARSSSLQLGDLRTCCCLPSFEFCHQGPSGYVRSQAFRHFGSSRNGRNASAQIATPVTEITVVVVVAVGVPVARWRWYAAFFCSFAKNGKIVYKFNTVCALQSSVLVEVWEALGEGCSHVCDHLFVAPHSSCVLHSHHSAYVSDDIYRP